MNNNKTGKITQELASTHAEYNKSVKCVFNGIKLSVLATGAAGIAHILGAEDIVSLNSLNVGVAALGYSSIQSYKTRKIAKKLIALNDDIIAQLHDNVSSCFVRAGMQNGTIPADNFDNTADKKPDGIWKPKNH